MRRAWIVGCVLLLAACSKKVTVSAVDLSVEYKGYVPQCVRVTVSDAEAPKEHTSSETLSKDLLASQGDRTVRIAVYREESWSQRLQIEVASFKDTCGGTLVETRKLESVTLPAKGTEPRTLALLAADADNDGSFARSDDGAIQQANDCNDQNGQVRPGAVAVCDGAGNLGIDFNCDGKSDCNGSTCTSNAQCGSGFCVDGVCCNDACNSPPTCRGTGVCNAPSSLGACTYPVTPNVNCNDGNGCTLNDKCDNSGVCVGGTAKVCNTAPGQCYAGTGTCKPLTGACEYAPLSNTTVCDDGNKCTSADKCNGSGVCTGAAKTCNASPGQCYASTGTCNPGSGDCDYAALPDTEPCNDNNKCTDADKCNGSGTCAGTAKVCNSSPGQCFASTGTCNSGSGNCDYAALSNTTSCNDGKDCTSPDKCDGLGACASTMSCPPPNECKVASTTACFDTGACVFDVNTAQVGKVCNEGGKKGTCSPQGTCLRFNYTVTPNFTPETLVEGRTLDDVTVSCAATLDTSGTTPTWSDSGCGFPKPTPVVVGNVVVVPVRNLVVDAPLRLVGTRSVVFAVYGNATLNEEIRANSVRTETEMVGGAGSAVGCTGRVGTSGGHSGSDGSGGGGGGLATAGARGGDNDDSGELGAAGGNALASGFSPLAGGCAGGDGGAPGGVTVGKGGLGGGSVQLSVAGTLTLRSVVTTSGAGGKGGGVVSGKTGGGGGGGSGGLLVLEAEELVVESSAKLTANGGAGGEGGSDSNGTLAVGDDGDNGNATSSNPASGGTDGSTGGGDGGSGAAGTAGPGTGSKGTGSGANHGAGGGGGGGAGRILLRGVTSCSAIPPDSVISPVYDNTGGACAAPALR